MREVSECPEALGKVPPRKSSKFTDLQRIYIPEKDSLKEFVVLGMDAPRKSTKCTDLQRKYR